MAMLKKVRSCCCGCSLELGTQIILWLTVLGAVSSLCNYSFGKSSGSLQSNGVSGATIIEGIVAAIALYGISNRNSGLLLPYLIVAVIMLIGIALSAVLLIIFSIFAAHVIKAAVNSSEQSSHGSGSDYTDISSFGSSYPRQNTHADADAAAGAVTGIMIVLLIVLCIIFAIKWYLTTVVYSYYCELKENTSSAGQVIAQPGYGVPPEQGPQPGYSYPPSYGQQPPPGYAPAYGQQPAAVYPQCETKN